jgi:hypothetical protein
MHLCSDIVSAQLATSPRPSRQLKFRARGVIFSPSLDYFDVNWMAFFEYSTLLLPFFFLFFLCPPHAARIYNITNGFAAFDLGPRLGALLVLPSYGFAQPSMVIAWRLITRHYGGNSALVL